MINSIYYCVLVLLNSTNLLRKSDKMLCKHNMLSVFSISLNKFNKRGHSCKILYTYIYIFRESADQDLTVSLSDLNGSVPKTDIDISIEDFT